MFYQFRDSGLPPLMIKSPVTERVGRRQETPLGRENFPPAGPPSYLTCLITFSCYGHHLHGDVRGSVDLAHNTPGTPLRPAESALEKFERGEMKEPAYLLDARRREVVLGAIIEVCRHRGWLLLAAHIRETHLHIVGDGECTPENMMGDFKRYASRALNAAGLDGGRQHRWARHGSTRILRDGETRERAIRYVLEKQGAPMAVYVLPGQRAPLPSRLP